MENREENKKICFFSFHKIKCNNIIQDKIADNHIYCEEHKNFRNDFCTFTEIAKNMIDFNLKLGTIEKKYINFCNFFDFCLYNRKLVNTMNQRFNNIVNKKIDELENHIFITQNNNKINKIKNYKKYFIWNDLNDVLEDKNNNTIYIDINEKIEI